MAEKALSLQDQFLNTVRRSKSPVTVFLMKGVNFYTDLTGCIVLEVTEDIRNTLLHGVGHFTVSHFSRGLQGTPAWLEEAWGNYIEHVKLGNGHVACSTNSK